MFDDDELPRAVVDLVRHSILSFEALEVVLLLQRAEGRRWTAAQVAAQVHAPGETVLRALDSLIAKGLVMRVGDQLPVFEYQPRDAQLAAAVGALAEVCESNRVGVMLLISSSAIGRVRSGALRAFSDALRRARDKGES